MLFANSTILVASIANTASNAILISLLATLAFTFFSMVVSTVYKKNFVEPVLLGKVINFYLKDSPTWLNVMLGAIVHFFVGYLFTEVHLYLYQILTPVWYNAIFLGLANGFFGAFVWYITILTYQEVLKVHIYEYLVQLIIGHIIFGLVILYMYAPPFLENGF